MAYEDHPTFDVQLVTPDGPVFDGEAHMLVVPGQAGEIGVLARHAPLVATLKVGSTRIHVGGGDVVEFATGPGFFKVELDRALALVDDAVDVKEIDDERAREQLEAARAELERVESWRVERRPLAARAANPARREPARGLGSDHRLSRLDAGSAGEGQMPKVSVPALRLIEGKAGTDPYGICPLETFRSQPRAVRVSSRKPTLSRKPSAASSSGAA